MTEKVNTEASTRWLNLGREEGCLNATIRAIDSDAPKAVVERLVAMVRNYCERNGEKTSDDKPPRHIWAALDAADDENHRIRTIFCGAWQSLENVR